MEYESMLKNYDSHNALVTVTGSAVYRVHALLCLKIMRLEQAGADFTRSGLLKFTPSSAPACQSSENKSIKAPIKAFACETTLKTRLRRVRQRVRRMKSVQKRLTTQPAELDLVCEPH
ncbi:hypothetical protein G5714_001202 [Onychostoma macrolepis]|uniref:Uncharacterized protein n=1 Tax=Onychostoma macrolepis TaxID=369639 RepID=A0A7J6DJ64_9TELE|nr:hypothetical protein G5714_001202 [Onychostoma macrolepis]